MVILISTVLVLFGYAFIFSLIGANTRAVNKLKR